MVFQVGCGIRYRIQPVYTCRPIYGPRQFVVPLPLTTASLGRALPSAISGFGVRRHRRWVLSDDGLGKKSVTRNSNPEYPKPEFCSGISGSNLQNPNLVRVIRVSQSGTRNNRITRTFMCHVLMSCLIINVYIYNYVYVCITYDYRFLVFYIYMYIIIKTIFLY
jgi:hypothetical protein